jgi:hypothetical protein
MKASSSGSMSTIFTIVSPELIRHPSGISARSRTDRRVSIRYPGGRHAPATPAPASSTVPITLDEEEIGTVWLERPGAPGRLDDLLLDRLAIAAAAVVERYGPARTTMADPALVELVISADHDPAASARALRLLGFPADLPVRVAAVRSPLPLGQVAGLVCPARPVKAAPLADVGVILATTLDPARFPARRTSGEAARSSGPTPSSHVTIYGSSTTAASGCAVR